MTNSAPSTLDPDPRVMLYCNFLYVKNSYERKSFFKLETFWYLKTEVKKSKSKMHNLMFFSFSKIFVNDLLEIFLLFTP